ncbi:S8 family serine peptidase [Oscillospiraceae bacterium OttesenSCG-928-F05]|nr:S8 family serine peptidase [Oscillospiraceae bacterium OttesenSCG-928-F05]
MRRRLAAGALICAVLFSCAPFAAPPGAAAGADLLELTDFDLNPGRYLEESVRTPDSAAIIELQIGNPSMRIDGDSEPIDAESGVAPVIENGRTLVPVRGIVESLGGEVRFEPATKQIDITYEDKELTLRLQSPELMVKDGGGVRREQMDVSAVSVDGSTLLPIKYVADNLDCGVRWVPETKTVVIENTYQTKRLIVTLHPGKRLDLPGRDVIESGGFLILQCESAGETKALYDVLLQNPAVKSVDIDTLFRAEALVGEGIASSWGGERVGASAMARQLTEEGKTARVVVAVADTGLDAYHSLFAGRTVPGYDLVRGGTVTGDGHGHGTHVAGIVAACTPDNIKIMPLKILGDNGTGSMLTLISGVRYAVQNGADVINLSACGPARSGAVEAVIDAAEEAGVLVVCAAGNDGEDTKDYYPAFVSSALVVSATAEDDSIPGYSNFGMSVDLAAPGDQIESSLPGGGFGALSGTSMAAPHVSAAAAMLICDGGYTPGRTADLLCRTADDRGPTGKDIFYGHGILNLKTYIAVTRGEAPPSPSPGPTSAPPSPGPGATPSPGGGIPVTGLIVGVSELHLPTGGSQRIHARVTPADATDKTIRFTSEKPEICTVDTGGLVRAISPGTGYIVVSAGGGRFSKTVPVFVGASGSGEISGGGGIVLAIPTLRVGESYDCSVGVDPGSGAVTYKSSDTQVATITEDGVLTALRPGQTQITVEISGGGISMASMQIVYVE